MLRLTELTRATSPVVATVVAASLFILEAAVRRSRPMRSAARVRWSASSTESVPARPPGSAPTSPALVVHLRHPTRLPAQGGCASSKLLERSLDEVQRV